MHSIPHRSPVGRTCSKLTNKITEIICSRKKIYKMRFYTRVKSPQWTHDRNWTYVRCPYDVMSFQFRSCCHKVKNTLECYLIWTSKILPIRSIFSGRCLVIFSCNLKQIFIGNYSSNGCLESIINIAKWGLWALLIRLYWIETP